MACKLVVFLGVVAVARAAIVPVAQPAAYVAAAPVVPAVAAKLEDFDAVPQYSFSYDVQDAITGDSKAQYETRNGDIVQGSYSLIEADGTRRIVDYTADPVNGFNAVVSREPAVAAIAGPSVGYAPAVGVAPVAPAAAPVPEIPSTGPDSEVEVIDARTGPLRNSNSAEKLSETSQRFQSQQQAKQSQNQQRQNEQQSQNKQQAEQKSQQLRTSARLASEPATTNVELGQAAVATPVRAFARPLAPAIPAALTANALRYVAPAPVAAPFTLSYPAYSAYTAAYASPYASPYAYTAPVSGLTYAPTYV